MSKRNLDNFSGYNKLNFEEQYLLNSKLTDFKDDNTIQEYILNKIKVNENVDNTLKKIQILEMKRTGL